MIVNEHAFLIMTEYKKYPFMRRADIRLFFVYFFVNPYRMVRKYLQRRGVKNPYQYGETPLSVIDALIEKAGGLEKYQYFADLGAGRGRISYFVSRKYRCKVFAYEQMKTFVIKGKKLFPHVTFIHGDFLKKDLSKLDLIYLYGTMMKEEEILEFVSKVKGHMRVITISYPLSDYDSRFKVIAKMDVQFPWGRTKGYVQCLRK